MWTTLLEILGLLLLVAATAMAFGIAAGAATAGACCLLTAWSMARPRPKVRR
jgi:hypothetical protein